MLRLAFLIDLSAGGVVRRFILVLGTVALTILEPAAQPAAVSGEWRHYSGTAGSTKYSALGQIDAGNVAALHVAWRWSSPDNVIAAGHSDVVPGSYDDTPLMVDGVLYTITSLGIFAAIDAGSGKTLWQYDPETWKAGRPTNLGFVHRGTAYWTDGTNARILAGTHDAYLLSIDAKTGELDPVFGVSGRVDLTERLAYVQRGRNYAISSAPIVVRDVVIVGASISDGPMNKEHVRGDVSGYDVRTGRRLWTFRSIPQAGEFGQDTWQGDAGEYTGNTNVWSLMSADEQLGYVYLPFGTPTNDYYGGHRPGDNLFAESLVCLDATTGRRVWHFQGVHHGLWDYDFPAAPVVGDITVEGRRISAVAQVSKQGFLYVLDRRTGEPVWPIEERPVPQSKVPGERTSSTQPFPTRPPAFERQGFSEDDVIEFTPALRQQALAIVRQYDMGPLFTPPSERGTIQLPGNGGGANWSGAAFDPDAEMLFVPSVTSPFLVQLEQPDATRSNLRYRRGPARLETVEGLPVVKPPYSRLTAYNLHDGTMAWQIPVGDGPRNHPLLKELNLGPLGGGRGYVLATRTLLFLAIRGTQRGDLTPADPPTLQALDKQTGTAVWKTELDHSPSSPMTYLHGGRQYIAMASGSGSEAEIVAFALDLPGQ
jgi:quinoprotein glucose dehydrogenase